MGFSYSKLYKTGDQEKLKYIFENTPISPGSYKFLHRKNKLFFKLPRPYGYLWVYQSDGHKCIGITSGLNSHTRLINPRYYQLSFDRDGNFNSAIIQHVSLWLIRDKSELDYAINWIYSCLVKYKLGDKDVP